MVVDIVSDSLLEEGGGSVKSHVHGNDNYYSDSIDNIVCTWTVFVRYCIQHTMSVVADHALASTVSLCTYQCIVPGITPWAKGGDLTCIKSIPFPPRANARIKCPP